MLKYTWNVSFVFLSKLEWYNLFPPIFSGKVLNASFYSFLTSGSAHRGTRYLVGGMEQVFFAKTTESANQQHCHWMVAPEKS